MSLVEEQSHLLEEKAADAMMAVLGFEALYPTDDDTFMKYLDDDRDDSAATSTSSAGDSVFGLDVLFSPGEQDMTELKTLSSEESGRERKIAKNTSFEKCGTTSGGEAGAPKRTVAWFHQQRVQKHRPGKVVIVMAVEENVAEPAPPKRMTSIKKTNRIIDVPEETSRPNNQNQNQNPDPLLHGKLPRRRTISQKMKGWLLKGTIVRDRTKTFEGTTSSYAKPEPPPWESPPEEEVTAVAEEEITMENEKTHRLTITLHKRRELQDEESSACCLFVDEVLNMGYFCQCLGEAFKEEGLKYTGIAAAASRDDENSVVDNITMSQEERTTYSV